MQPASQTRISSTFPDRETTFCPAGARACVQEEQTSGRSVLASDRQSRDPGQAYWTLLDPGHHSAPAGWLESTRFAVIAEPFAEHRDALHRRQRPTVEPTVTVPLLRHAQLWG